ncbi:MAG: multidrug effflux MFS transporter [Parachlamydiaceae bacterium]|nr:multidrug effflux MFS transporter [Parachlamydiaceae bacterium]
MKLSKFFPFLLIFSVVSAAMEIELSLPSFPDIARAFSVSEKVIEGTISLNFLGFCIAALFYGPLSDRFGRRPILLLGTVLFLIGSISCALAPTIEMILLSRFIQGLGAAGSFVIVFTMISDAYQDNEATHWIGMLNAILTATMALAPILGGYLNVYFGWSSCYTFVALMTTIQLILLYGYLPETRKGQVIQTKQVIQDYKQLLTSFRFLQSSLVPTLVCGGYMAFVSVIPFLYRDQLGMPLREFAWHQAAIISSFSIVSYYANKISSLFGEMRSALFGSLVCALATSTLLIMACFQEIPPVLLITPLMCLFASSCAIPFAIVFSASLSVVPNKNGPASSLLMSMRTLLCAVTVQLAGNFYNGTLFSSAAIVALCCMLSLFLTISFYGEQIRAHFALSLPQNVD